MREEAELAAAPGQDSSGGGKNEVLHTRVRESQHTKGVPVNTLCLSHSWFFSPMFDVLFWDFSKQARIPLADCSWIKLIEKRAFFIFVACFGVVPLSRVSVERVKGVDRNVLIAQLTLARQRRRSIESLSVVLVLVVLDSVSNCTMSFFFYFRGGAGA